LENSTAASQVLCSGADLAGSLSPQSYAELEIKGTQHSWDGKHSDAMMEGFRQSLNNTQHVMHLVAISSGTQEFLKHQSHNTMYIFDEQLQTMELCIYHGNKDQVEGLDGEHISRMCQSTGSQSRRGGDQWKD
jgi:hypothetical protein